MGSFLFRKSLKPKGFKARFAPQTKFVRIEI